MQSTEAMGAAAFAGQEAGNASSRVQKGLEASDPTALFAP